MKNEEVKARIIQYLSKQKDWRPTSVIKSALSLHYYATIIALHDLILDGKVQKEERGTYTYWRIKQ